MRILPDSHQALLYDRNRGTHVLAEIGTTIIGGYKVEDIDEDEVTLSANGREFVLAAPETDAPAPAPTTTTKRPTATKPAPAPTPAAADPNAPHPAAEAPADPYDDGTAPLDPTGDPAVVASSVVPVDPYASPKLRSVSASKKKPTTTPDEASALVPGSTAPSRTPVVVVVPPASGTAPAPAYEEDPYADPGVVAPAPVAPPKPVLTPTILSRTEVNRALADFASLTNMVRGSFTMDGARLDFVAENSVFARAGLKKGDVVTAIDQTPLKSIDDAAELYVRASSTRAANIHLIRAGKPLSLRVLMN